MSKKGFSGGLSSLLGESPKVKRTEQDGSGTENTKRKVGRPKTQLKVITKTSEEGTKEGEIRATFIVKTELLEKLKALAFFEHDLIKDFLEKHLEEVVDRYEKKGILKDALSLYAKKKRK
jgi:hypothetical protein